MTRSVPSSSLTTHHSPLLLGLLFVFGIGLCPEFSATPGLAQRRNSQSGEIQMELQDPKKKKPYKVTRALVKKKLLLFRDALQQGDFSTPPVFTTEELLLLAATHLYCTLKDGVCTLIPFTLYEMDLIRARSQKKASCPNLVRFWKQWIGADMEKRVGMNLKVVHYDKRTRFKTQVRPKLLKCSQTVRETYASATDKEQFLRQRYEEKSEKKDLPQQLVNYIDVLHQKVPNILIETGVRG
ncbi:hypothetical protein MRY87_13705 [bacterium]|nr:hypothetical protein [bacterium]